jgi:hypothetical protein
MYNLIVRFNNKENSIYLKKITKRKFISRFSSTPKIQINPVKIIKNMNVRFVKNITSIERLKKIWRFNLHVLHWKIKQGFKGHHNAGSPYTFLGVTLLLPITYIVGFTIGLAFYLLNYGEPEGQTRWYDGYEP